MKKKALVSIGLLLLSMMLGGCWDIKNLDELSVVIGIGMDAAKGEQIELTVQVVNPSQAVSGGTKGGGGGSSTVTTYSETGDTVFEAIRKIANKTSRKLYFAHNQILVIGEDLARRGVDPLFELIERDPEIRMDFYVLVAKQAKASDILKITTPIEKIPAVKLHDNVDNVEDYLGTAFKVSVKDVVQNMYSEKKQIIMGSVEIIGDTKKEGSSSNIKSTNPKTIQKLKGMAVFRDEKLIGYFKLAESRGNSWIQDKVKSTVVEIPCGKKGKYVIEIVHSNTTTKMKVQQGKRIIAVRVKQEADLAENSCPETRTSGKKIRDELEKRTQEQIKKEILESVDRAKKWKSDVFGFGSMAYKADPAYWKQNKDNWKDVFPQIPVEVEVKTEIRRDGTVHRSYYKKHN